jgi:hypothetical protein
MAAVETVRFAVDGAEYEIDLNLKNTAAFRKQLAPAPSTPARCAGAAPPGGAAGSGPRARRRDPGVGGRARYCISARGRIPADVVERYDAATDGG